MNIRHGDLSLIQIKELPEGLTETKSKVILEGKSNQHTFDKGKLYLKRIDEFVFGYFKAEKGTRLSHTEHGRKIKGKAQREIEIPKGVYELRVQHEDTNEGMKQVVD